MSPSKGKSGAARGAKKPSKPQWRVTEARFELSSPDLAHCPAADVPEIAIAGRSNVGKSSLLNAFGGSARLARVSKTPGRTRLLNYFALTLHSPKDERVECRVVDLPGYGFAKAHKSVRDTFGPMIGAYLRERTCLRALLVLVDSRRGPSELDVELLGFGAEVRLPCLVIATKGDKLSKSERGLIPKRFSQQLGGGVQARDILVTSSASGLGLDPRTHERGGALARELGRIIRTDARETLVAPEGEVDPSDGP
jgi:GTP-binding protein